MDAKNHSKLKPIYVVMFLNGRKSNSIQTLKHNSENQH